MNIATDAQRRGSYKSSRRTEAPGRPTRLGAGTWVCLVQLHGVGRATVTQAGSLPMTVAYLCAGTTTERAPSSAVGFHGEEDRLRGQTEPGHRI
jgi:hypothetical protein